MRNWKLYYIMLTVLVKSTNAFRYLVAELICSSSKMKEGLVSFITESMQSSYLKTDIEQSQMPKIPYLFKTPGGQVIDLRLHNRDLMRRATPHLRRILDNMMSGWFVERKHTMFAELQKEGVADKDIEKMANERISTEYLERVADALLNDKGVKALGPGVAELLIKQVRTSAVVAKVRADFSVEYEDQKETMDRELQKEHPVLYKVEGWSPNDIYAFILAYIKDSSPYDIFRLETSSYEDDHERFFSQKRMGNTRTGH